MIFAVPKEAIDAALQAGRTICALCGEPILPGEKTHRTSREAAEGIPPVHWDCKFGPDGC